jgi:hypothetical protein
MTSGAAMVVSVGRRKKKNEQLFVQPSGNGE